jgi:glutamate dehydrogenase/leucine dehydrogenase
MRQILARAFDEVLHVAVERGVSHRLAAQVIAIQRVAEATRMRGLYA